MTQNPNQFSQSVILGMLDMKFNTETISCQVVSSYSGDGLVAGQAVKVVDSAGGVPKVTPVTDDADEVFGFINYNIKNTTYGANDAVEISRDSNVIYLYAQEAISRGVQVCQYTDGLGDDAVGYVSGLEDGATIVGYTLDKAAAQGDLIRVVLSVPSFSVYSAS
jgi:hypothetical protein